MAAKMLGPEGGWIGGSHIDWIREQVPASPEWGGHEVVC